MSRIVAWTGHRPDIFLDPAAARAEVTAVARDLVMDEGAERFVVGGQRGVDTWAAKAAIALDVRYIVVLPLTIAEFAADWTADDRALLLELVVAHASEVHVVGGDPTAAYTTRNRQLVSQADLVVAVWTQLGGGGTAETVALARAAGVPVREIVLPIAQMAHSAQGRGI